MQIKKYCYINLFREFIKKEVNISIVYEIQGRLAFIQYWEGLVLKILI